VERQFHRNQTRCDNLNLIEIVEQKPTVVSSDKGEGGMFNLNLKYRPSNITERIQEEQSME
jgi:hypothetical protein